MNTPSVYLAESIRRLRSIIPDCTAELRCGADRGAVLLAGSPGRGEDPIAEDVLQDDIKAIALAADFKELTKDAVVILDGKMRIVVSAVTDPANTHLNISMTPALDTAECRYAGVRPNGVEIDACVMCATMPDGLDAGMAESSTGSTRNRITVAIAKSDDGWMENTMPQKGDRMVMPDGRTFAVADVAELRGAWKLTVREVANV